MHHPRLFRVLNTSHRILFHPRPVGHPAHATTFELVTLGRPPSARLILPALRHLVEYHYGGWSFPFNTRQLAVQQRSGVSGAMNLRLVRFWDDHRPTRLGTLVVRREKHLARLHLSTGGRFTCGLSGNVRHIAMLVRLAGFDSMTQGWDFWGVTEEQVRISNRTSARAASC